MMARVAIARATAEVTIAADEAWRAGADIGALLIGANSAVLARVGLAEISLGFAIATHPSRFAYAIVVVV